MRQEKLPGRSESPLVIYYSNQGSNRFLAQKITKSLNCDMEEIVPRLNLFPLQLIFSAIKRGLGIKRIQKDLASYQTIILCGPIWMGHLISPLRSFLKNHGKQIRQLYFVSCCGSSDEMKEKKFGYGLVFKQVKDLMGPAFVGSTAFPITMVLPEEKREDAELVMKTRLSESNFTGQIRDRYDQFIENFKNHRWESQAAVDDIAAAKV